MKKPEYHVIFQHSNTTNPSKQISNMVNMDRLRFMLKYFEPPLTALTKLYSSWVFKSRFALIRFMSQTACHDCRDNWSAGSTLTVLIMNYNQISHNLSFVLYSKKLIDQFGTFSIVLVELVHHLYKMWINI